MRSTFLPFTIKIIDALKKEHADNEIQIEQYSHGGHKRKREAMLGTLKTRIDN